MSLILGEQTLSTDSMQNTTLAFLHRKHAWVSLFLLIFMQCRGIRVKNLQRRLWEQVLAVVLLCWVSYWYSCCTVWGKKFKKLQWRSRLCPTALTTNRNSLTKKATETIPFIFYSTLNQFRQLSRPSGHSVKTLYFLPGLRDLCCNTNCCHGVFLITSPVVQSSIIHGVCVQQAAPLQRHSRCRLYSSKKQKTKKNQKLRTSDHGVITKWTR